MVYNEGNKFGATTVERGVFMKPLRLAIQVYSVRDAAEADFVRCMKDLKAMGYEGVELAGTYGMTPVQVKAILDEIGLVLVSAHVGADLMWDDALMADYAATGMKYIAVPWFHKPTDQAFLAENIEKFRVLGERMRSFGLQLGYHNHDFELATVPGDGRCALEAYYEEIPADLLKTQLDLAWVRAGGKDPVEFLRRYPGRAPTVHIKDYKGTFGAEDFQLCPVGDGCQDISGLLDAARAVGTEWLIVEQDQPNGGRTRMECAAISAEKLKPMM